jgi:3-deoxy-alpha-D-manno-octulosonate 8-oxidase
MGILDSGIRNVRNVLRYTIGSGSLDRLPELVDSSGARERGRVVYFVDDYFSSGSDLPSRLGVEATDQLEFVDTKFEPSTDAVDVLAERVKTASSQPVGAIVGTGGGSAMDVAKAVANLLTNPGRAADYQGWDLVREPAIYKIAVPTLSGTGAEATRTCVMTNKRTGLKLGMNSDFTVYDQIVMDPDLTASVPRNQYFYTGMDAYIHCMEALSGHYRNAIGDAFSRETLALCRQVFLEGDMMSALNRERLMVGSYLGGCAIATSYVGVVHPFSAGLSVVLGVKHCVANCIVMRAMAPFYGSLFDEFWQMVQAQSVEVPKGVCANLASEQYDQLYSATVIHEKPLANALGEDYRLVLTRERVEAIFRAM